MHLSNHRWVSEANLLGLHSSRLLKERPQWAFGANGALKMHGCKQKLTVLALSFDSQNPSPCEVYHRIKMASMCTFKLRIACTEEQYSRTRHYSSARMHADLHGEAEESHALCKVGRQYEWGNCLGLAIKSMLHHVATDMNS